MNKTQENEMDTGDISEEELEQITRKLIARCLFRREILRHYFGL